MSARIRSSPSRFNCERVMTSSFTWTMTSSMTVISPSWANTLPAKSKRTAIARYFNFTKLLLKIDLRPILISGLYLEQHVTSKLQNIVLFVFGKDEPQDARWCEHGARVLTHEISQFFRRNSGFFTEFHGDPVGRFVYRNEPCFLSRAPQTGVRKKPLDRRRNPPVPVLRLGANAL